ncbi:tetratricopeptide repeat protein [Virgibacillus flavescens]|uniref:tetratricopeptide repeat protein n=1 Tax=Virgibacillus flavescens TaxID=1611422 RepID=UPI003D32CE31
MEKENVILFPKWKKKLEEESLFALKEKRYEEALHKLDQLLDYQVNNHEILIGKLICLMELDRHDDAEELSERLLRDKDENYYHYLHIYLTILFQTHQYKKLMDLVDLEVESSTIPHPMRQQFQQLYAMSEKMNVEIKDERSTKYINQLVEAIREKDHVKQWRTVENLRKINASPSLETTSKLLTESLIHPVTKTAIFMWLQDNQVEENVDIHKLDIQMSVIPSKVSQINVHGTYKQILLFISEVEHKNPTLYQFIKTLLYRYIYVRYPIMPSNIHVKEIAKALTNIGETTLGINQSLTEEIDSEVLRYQEEVKLCETLYLSVIEE